MNTNERNFEFDDETIQGLFGHEAAEDEDEERLKEYFIKNRVYKNFTANLSLRILVGHKGTGKSAMIKYSAYEDKESGKLPIFIQPNDIANLDIEKTGFIQSVSVWEEGLLNIISSKVLETLNFNKEYNSQNLKHYGNKVVTYLLDTVSIAKQHVNLAPTQKYLVDNFLEHGKIVVYIDDLDRGWLNRQEDINRISTLLNAVRDISNENKNINFKIALRTDVYYAIRTSDESTDKIEGSVIWYSWSNHEILALLVKRILTYFNEKVEEDHLIQMSQPELAKYLNRIMADRFNGKGKWANAPTYRILMSLIRKRPRDLVKLCTLASRDAYQKNQRKIETDNLREIFEPYSQGRIQDTVNEYRSEFPGVERLLMGMKPNKREKKTAAGYIYNTASLEQKISNVLQHGEMKFSNGKKATPKDLAIFLYKINFLTARKNTSDGKVQRKYFEESRYISSTHTDFGYDWEVHPAYRWALQPDSIEEIYNQLDILNIEL